MPNQIGVKVHFHINDNIVCGHLVFSFALHIAFALTESMFVSEPEASLPV